MLQNVKDGILRIVYRTHIQVADFLAAMPVSIPVWKTPAQSAVQLPSESIIPLPPILYFLQTLPQMKRIVKLSDLTAMS